MYAVKDSRVQILAYYLNGDSENPTYSSKSVSELIEYGMLKGKVDSETMRIRFKTTPLGRKYLRENTTFVWRLKNIYNLK